MHKSTETPQATGGVEKPVENVENFCLFSKFRAFLNSKKARYPLCFPTFPQKRGGKLCIFMHAFSDFSTRKSQKGKLYNLYNHAFFCQKMPPKKAFFSPFTVAIFTFFSMLCDALFRFAPIVYVLRESGVHPVPFSAAFCLRKEGRARLVGLLHSVPRVRVGRGSLLPCRSDLLCPHV